MAIPVEKYPVEALTGDLEFKSRFSGRASSVRDYGACLRDAGLCEVGQVASKTAAELLQVPGIGEGAVFSIQRALHAYDLSLARPSGDISTLLLSSAHESALRSAGFSTVEGIRAAGMNVVLAAAPSRSRQSLKKALDARGVWLT